MNRYKATNKASLLGIIFNLFLLVIKGIIAIISNSQAMLADAFNSFGDVLSSLMTMIGNKISSKEADDDHNLGHGKAEYIYSLLISIVMLFTAYSVIKNSILTYIHHDKINFSIYLVVVSLITIITKLSLEGGLKGLHLINLILFPLLQLIELQKLKAFATFK